MRGRPRVRERASSRFRPVRSLRMEVRIYGRLRRSRVGAEPYGRVRKATRTKVPTHRRSTRRSPGRRHRADRDQDCGEMRTGLTSDRRQGRPRRGAWFPPRCGSCRTVSGGETTAEPKPERTVYHVMPDEEGEEAHRWQVQHQEGPPGGVRVAPHRTQQEAIVAVRRQAKQHEPAQVVAHGTDGRTPYRADLRRRPPRHPRLTRRPATPPASRSTAPGPGSRPMRSQLPPVSRTIAAMPGAPGRRAASRSAPQMPPQHLSHAAVAPGGVSRQCAFRPFRADGDAGAGRRRHRQACYLPSKMARWTSSGPS
ncbi:DUF2188 domain-containing protein [Streptomyces sp. DH12]|uniref:DUF2188 domain-containing protein n=1 Tax=Streptomyces sp. DH12 TaxID=2857010 RepID=UPI0034D744EE